ncbi:TRAP transporter large permease subunit [Rathayibacter sp. VKM Ac-2803]|uniref:TRAP transporter large permease n=1 Tax=unclassified Rathayibacter TaxID=2609250 RepID=UPI001359F030|nr:MULTISPECIES: TRAP transporter large permease [unclassified Rathayibacter]MWV47776.1 TRAP transporter large permease subunit [Rathayibacter sp. VKM Ac-2803]MWV59013.1 TRAP transporter large permease subunit [Rathayibacter sp. VKM Ac-2754]
MDTATVIATVVLLGGITLGITFGLPVAVAMGLPSALAIVVLLGWEGAALTSAQRVFAGTNSFALLSIPFFILAGGLMNTGGIATRLIDLALVIAGRLPAPLAQTTVVANAMFGAVSGASVASAAAVGTVLSPRMRKDGYDPAFSAAVNAAASPAGMLIPPSNTFIVYALVSSTSIAALFLAGVGPGLLWVAICAVVVALHARKNKGLPVAARPTARQGFVILLRAIPALLMIVIVIGGILSGFFTATESAVIAVIYSFLLGLAQRTLPLKSLPKVVLDASKTTAIVMLLIGVSSILAWVLSYARIPQLITEGLLGVTDNVTVILILIMVVLLLAGTVMDPTPAILIFTPIFLPVVTALGVSPIHFGAMMVFNMCLGNISPPIGNNLFVAARVAGVRIEPVISRLWPFFWALCVGLFIVTFVPQLSLWLPTAFGLIAP